MLKEISHSIDKNMKKSKEYFLKNSYLAIKDMNSFVKNFAQNSRRGVAEDVIAEVALINGHDFTLSGIVGFYLEFSDNFRFIVDC